MRPFKKEVYHPFRWRGWFDFGNGGLADFCCHAINLPMRALDLGYPERIVVNMQDGKQAADKAAVEFHFPARGKLVPRDAVLAGQRQAAGRGAPAAGRRLQGQGARRPHDRRREGLHLHQPLEHGRPDPPGRRAAPEGRAAPRRHQGHSRDPAAHARATARNGSTPAAARARPSPTSTSAASSPRSAWRAWSPSAPARAWTGTARRWRPGTPPRPPGSFAPSTGRSGWCDRTGSCTFRRTSPIWAGLTVIAAAGTSASAGAERDGRAQNRPAEPCHYAAHPRYMNPSPRVALRLTRGDSKVTATRSVRHGTRSVGRVTRSVGPRTGSLLRRTWLFRHGTRAKAQADVGRYCGTGQQAADVRFSVGVRLPAARRTVCGSRG